MSRSILFFLIISVTQPLLSLNPLPSARADAMGGIHPSLDDDFASVFSNPAGIASLEPTIRYSNLDFRLTGTFWKVLNVFNGSDASSLFPVDDGTFVGLGMRGPIDVGYAGDGMAWRISSYTSLDIFYPNVAVSSDFIFSLGASFTGGWGTTFHPASGITMDLGITGKGFHEQRYLGEADAAEFTAIIEEMALLLDMPFQVVPGFGFDAGFVTRFGNKWTASITVKDLFTMEFVSDFKSTNDLLDGKEPESSGIIVPIPEISLGGSWHPDLSSVKWFDISGIYLSFFHLLGGLEEYPVNYLLGIAAGMEMKFWDFLAFRIGYSEGMPALGLGFAFGGVDMDFTFSGEELSNQPGVFSVVDLRFAFAFETKPGKLN